MKSSVEQELEALFARHDCSFEPLVKADLWVPQQRWRETFAKQLHLETGKWTLSGFDWHTFSHGYYERLSGRPAELRYKELSAMRYFILGSELRIDVGYRVDGALVDLSEFGQDLSVVPENFEWTMAYTHELGFGPYFAVAPEFTDETDA